jgi:peroxiredoxin Q/BCP
MLAVGDKAPEFTARDQNGEEHSLDELLAGQHLVLYFYPKDFTFICTREACAFRDRYQELHAAGARVAGVSFDDVETHKKFSDVHELPFPLLDDSSRRITAAYGAKGLLGIGPKRVTYVIAPDRTIRGAFHHELSAKKHVDQVKALLTNA